MINPFLNPILLFKTGKSYLFDVNRIWKLSPEKLKKYQSKMLKKTVKYAYKNVTFYRKKCIEHGVKPKDIKSIDDIRKLPLITKDDIRKADPKEIIPKNIDVDKLWKIKTSGSTGEPFYFYKDIYGLLKDTIYGIRQFKINNIKWNGKLTNIGSHNSPNKYDYALKHAITDNLKLFIKSGGHQNIDYFDKDIKEKMIMINSFKPDLIFGYPEDIYALANLKKQGYGIDIKPKAIVTSGGMVDRYMKEYIETAFNCRLIDMYGSVEIGSAACQCKKGNYHIYSDFVYVEVLDKNGKQVKSGETGKIVVTRLLHGGTPFIRYTGLNDIVTPIYEKCECGLNTPILKHIEGRKASQIILPDGKYITPITFVKGIYKTMKKLNTDKIARYQIVQETKDKISILVIIDEKQRNNNPSVNVLFSEIKNQYKEIFGKDINIEVKEVKKVIDQDNPSKPAPIIISRIK